VIRVKVVLRLEFVEAFRPWLDLRNLIRAGQGTDAGELQGPPIVIAKQEQARRVVLNVRGVVVEQEARAGSDLQPKLALDQLSTLSDPFPFPDVALLRVDLLAIDPYELPFHELVAKVKQAMLCGNPLTAASTDLSVVMDEQIDADTTRHLQIGPMLPAQLNEQFLMIPRTDLPQQFLFVSTALTVRRRMAFSIEALRAVVAEFEETAAATAAGVSEIVRA
jgi:hypothetical protein